MEQQSQQPEPVDLSHHLSHVTRARRASMVKDFYKYFQLPGIGNLAAGMPNHNYFPFDTLESSAALPARFKPTPNEPVKPPSLASLSVAQLGSHTAHSITAKTHTSAVHSSLSSSSSPSAGQVVVPHESDSTDALREIDVKTALQYGTAEGYPPLYTLLRYFARNLLHPNVPYAGGPEIVLTCGNTDGLAKTIEALTNPWLAGRDPISQKGGVLCEEFAYMNALQTIEPRGLNIVPVKIDSEGMLADGPGGLRDLLENWDFAKGARPKLMYTVTIGQNPTTGTLSVARRKALYKLCVKYDIIIIEDDPYWYLQFPSAGKHYLAARSATSATPDLPGARNYNQPRSSGYEFLDSLVPSYLSIDYEGRVVRLDTFSKTVAPGCRLGWLTAQPVLVERILRITETSTQQPSGFVQSMIAQLILGDKGVVQPEAKPTRGVGQWLRGESKSRPRDPTPDGWQLDGWVRWLEGMRGNYERRMNTMCSILDAGRFALKSGRRPSLDALAMRPVSVVISSSAADVVSASVQNADSADDGWSVVSKTQMYSFNWPVGGMFVWLRMHFEEHPLARKVPHSELSDALFVFLAIKPFRVLLAPGTIFSPNTEIEEEKGWMYFRLCFAAVDEDDVGSISKRLVQGLNAFWRKKDIKEVKDFVELSAKIRSGQESMAMRGEVTSLIGGC